MKRMSKAFYLWSIIGSFTVLFLLTALILKLIVVLADKNQTENHAVIGLVLFTILMFAVEVYFFIVFGIMIYRMWEAIEGEGTPIFPVLAVVLFFIPFVNVFWYLLVFPLYTKYYNGYIKRRAIGVKALNPGLFYAYPFLFVSQIIGIFVGEIVKFMPGFPMKDAIFIPFALVGILAFFTSFVVFLVIVSRLCDAVNALPHVAEGLAAHPEKAI